MHGSSNRTADLRGNKNSLNKQELFLQQSAMLTEVIWSRLDTTCIAGSHKIRCPSNPPFISSFASLAQWCITEEIALVVVGPEAPLVDGIADVLEAKGMIY